MISSKKICFITPNLNMGGMERVLSILANYAIENGFSVYIVCLIDNEIHYSLSDRVNIISPSFKYQSGLNNKKKVALYLFKTLKDINPDSILSFSEAFNPLAIIVSKIARYPIYISDRSSPNVKLKPSTQLLRKLTYPLANGLILQTKLAKQAALRKGYNSNIAIIPNPLKSIKEYPNISRKNIIISVGRLIPSKNFIDLIDIFNSTTSRDSWKLLILGEGSERANLEKKITQLGLIDRVKLIGAVKDVDRYLAEASIFAFTSMSEGFPNALSEAMAAPLACISYDCISGPSELIEDEVNGYLIPLNDRNKFQSKLQRLMSAPDLRRQFTLDYLKHREKYSIDVICKQYINFILK